LYANTKAFFVFIVFILLFYFFIFVAHFMSLSLQKYLFQLPTHIHYLNAAYMSPLLKSVEEIGINALIRKRNPVDIPPSEFFSEANKLRQIFGNLIHADSKQIAIIPSASYGLANAINNLPIDNGNEAIVLHDDFPSGYYALEKWANQHGKRIKSIAPSTLQGEKGRAWNEKILSQITTETSVVVMSSIHWADGTIFDLKAIGEACKIHNVTLVVDGTQSVGVMPMDVELFGIDALVCAGYKWLLGPYSIGMAFYCEKYNAGIPIEESWLNRSNAHDFSNLTNYVQEYEEGAGRYNMGQFSNFIHVAMLKEGIEQIIKWKPENICDYCEQISQPLFEFLKKHNFPLEDKKYRAPHLFGIYLPASFNRALLMNKLEKRNIHVSLRGDAIRISLHLFNVSSDIEALISVLNECLTTDV
jgi:selenocysteine lyase/cysteine desulfurase